jgi:hypothetical protein
MASGPVPAVRPFRPGNRPMRARIRPAQPDGQAAPVADNCQATVDGSSSSSAGSSPGVDLGQQDVGDLPEYRDRAPEVHLGPGRHSDHARRRRRLSSGVRQAEPQARRMYPDPDQPAPAVSAPQEAKALPEPSANGQAGPS